MLNENVKKYPPEEECLKLIEKYEMLPNIVAHSIQVKNVTAAIYKHLRNKEKVNIELLVAAALLHDIAKTKSILLKELRHDLTGGEMLRNLGLDEIADIVESHVILKGFDPDGPLMEKEIIYYADKRVMHDKVVNIDTRVDDLVKRYGRTEKIKEMILDNKKFVLQLENKIQSHMDIDIEDALIGL